MSALKPTAVATVDAEGVHVVTQWSGVDRERGLGFLLGKGKAKQVLAARLVRAIEDGVIFRDPKVKTDIYGETYVAAICAVLGRTVNADLTRLGY